MGLLKQYGVNISNIERILVSLETPESVGYRTRIEGITIEGKDIDYNTNVAIHNKLVDNMEFNTSDGAINYIVKQLGLPSADLIELH